ncbi:MAG: hypothetical protein ACJA0S_000422 [Rickettsiales bacterium]
MNKKLTKEKVATTKILEEVVSKTSSDKIPIKDLIFAMDVGGFGLVMTISSLAILIPLPPPFPSLIAIPMMIFSFQLMLGYHSPKLPKRFSNFSISRNILATIIEKSSPFIRKAESFVHPRLLVLSDDFFKRVIGFFGCIFTLSVLIPIPLTNLIPGLGYLIASFGLLGRDGLIILIGLVIGCIGTALTAITLFIGVEFLHIIKNWFLQIF